MTRTAETGSELMAAAFAAEGAGPVFGVMGKLNMDWMVDMARTPGAVIHARDEGAAVSMADGFARATGKVGVATCTGGPGLTHTATAMRAAAHYRSPVVVVAGQQVDPDNIQYLDQQNFVESLGAAAVQATAPASIVSDVCKAFYLARTESRPVVLNVPMSVFRGTAERPRKTPMSSLDLLAARRPSVPDPVAVAEVAERLSAARRPLLLVGGGARSSAGDISKLATKVGALTASTLLGHGWLADVDGDLGIAGFFAPPQLRELQASADVVLALGASLDAFTTDGGLFDAADMIAVDRLPTLSFNAAAKADLHVQADVGRFVSMLLETCRRGDDKWRTPSIVSKLHAAALPVIDEVGTPDGRLDPRKIVRALDEAMPRERTEVTGAGHFWNFAVRQSRPPLHARLVSHGFGSIGHGLTTAIGAAFGEPDRPALVYEGDSGLLMNIQELDTLARTGLHLLVVVMNNSALGSEYYHLMKDGRDPAEAVLPDVDFAAIAGGFGIRAATVAESAEQIPALVKEFLASGKPMLIDVKTSLEIIDENYRWW